MMCRRIKEILVVFPRYWSMIKSLQTGLLLTTGIAGFVSCKYPVFNLPLFFGMSVSLFLAISGSTVLNMWYDQDIDFRMQRTCWRPLPAGKISPQNALRFGILLSMIGIGLGLWLSTLFGVIVFTGLFVNVVIYTIWLKRRSAWSIIWGGIAGGMPILAGRSLGSGQIDWIGISLALAILFWIPTHILTFNMRYHVDYLNAGIPTFPTAYGFQKTRATIAISSLLAALSMGIAAAGIGLEIGYLRLMGVLSIGLILLAISSMYRPSEKVNFGLFKYASLFMLSSMLLLVINSF